jgi:flagellar hook protein FlgE
VAANNIANVSTDGFKKSRAVLSTVQPRGVKAEVEQARQPGQARWSKRLKVTSL